MNTEQKKTKILTFKEYVKNKKLPESMETSFGKHSLPKKPESMETSFGKHSEKIDEKISPDSIPRMTAKETNHIHEKAAPIHDNLSEPHLDAVKEYSDDSHSINDMLHRHDRGYDISTRNSSDYKNTAKHLDAALNQHKTNEDIHVYTGIKYLPSKHFKKVDGKIPEKTTVKLPAYTSTSSSFHSAREFSDMTMHPNDERHGIEKFMYQKVLTQCR
jgi:hypothetical protein